MKAHKVGRKRLLEGEKDVIDEEIAGRFYQNKLFAWMKFSSNKKMFNEENEKGKNKTKSLKEYFSLPFVYVLEQDLRMSSIAFKSRECLHTSILHNGRSRYVSKCFFFS